MSEWVSEWVFLIHEQKESYVCVIAFKNFCDCLKVTLPRRVSRLNKNVVNSEGRVKNAGYPRQQSGWRENENEQT